MNPSTKKTRVSTAQLWADYCRLGTTKAVAELHGYKGHNNVVQRLNAGGYQLRRPGRRRQAGAER